MACRSRIQRSPTSWLQLFSAGWQYRTLEVALSPRNLYLSGNFFLRSVFPPCILKESFVGLLPLSVLLLLAGAPRQKVLPFRVGLPGALTTPSHCKWCTEQPY